MLAVNHLHYSYGKHHVLKDISFTLNEGELVFLLGTNGAGKSTLFRCILGLLHDYQGDITLNGVNTRTMSAKELARNLAYIPQSHHPTFPYSVLDMVLMGTNHRLSTFQSPGPKERAVAMDALAQMGIDQLAHRNFQELSGGQQQMVLIARGLAQQGKILLMDEPTSSLDYGNQLRVLDKVTQLAKQGYTIFLSCHNPQQALLYAHRVIALHQRDILADGPPNQVLSEGLLQKLYQVPVQLIQTQAGALLAPVRKSMYRWTPDMIRFMEDAGPRMDIYPQVAQMLAGATPNRGTVCDAGCGLGFSSMALAKHFRRVVAVDVNPDALEVLRRRNTHDNLEIVQDDFFALTGGEVYDAMLFCCFGRMEEILRAVKGRCSGTVLVVQKDANHHRFSVGPAAQQHQSRFAQLEEEMARSGIPFESRRITVDMGQPLRSLEDGVLFFQTYHQGDDLELISLDYVKSRLLEQDEAQFPYYLPMETTVGLLSFDAKYLNEKKI